ncbi:MAG: sugar phosphate isomerase/epimerase [Phycisphaeraceae bacterium]|nr:sugar phosphate isomerase/epimerase [Phycisphaeraceae bacterium]
MYVDLSPGAVGIPNMPFDQLVQLARTAGFEGVDAPVGQIMAAPDPKIFNDQLRAAGLRWGCFPMPVEFRSSDEKFEKDMAELKKIAPKLSSLGVTRTSTWMMPCHNELDYDTNFKRHADRLRKIGQVLRDSGIRLGVEFVAPMTLVRSQKYPFIHTLDQLLQLLDAIGLPNMGVLLDSFHWHCSGATADDITHKLSNEKIVLVHVCDARSGRSREEQIDNERALPGVTNVIDWKGFVGSLRKLAYDGPVAAEPFDPTMAQKPPAESAGLTVKTIRQVLAVA